MLVGNSPRRLYSSKKISNKHYEELKTHLNSS
jgi:hypothetical protein